MSEAYNLNEEGNDQRIWNVKKYEINEMILLPNDPSAFPYGIKELCESGINILCGIPSLPCSG